MLILRVMQCKLTALIKCFEFLDATHTQKFLRFIYIFCGLLIDEDFCA